MNCLLIDLEQTVADIAEQLMGNFYRPNTQDGS
jgi:hypothetical protein